MVRDSIQKQINQLLTQYIQTQKKSRFIPGKTKIRYASAYYGEEELIAVTDALLSGWFGLGVYGERLERDLANYIGCHSTLLTNSGSSASLLSLAALTSDLYAEKIAPGMEVVTPACTFATTAAAIVHRNLTPVFIDVELGTYNATPHMYERAITKKTRALLIPHTLGNPNEMDTLLKIAKKYKLHIIEDNCDALGSMYDGQKTGSFGVLATCSFYPAHHLTLAGEGGAVFINDPRLHRVVLTYRNWGRGCWCTSLEKNPNGACGHRFDFKIDGIPVDHKYYFLTLGYNLKPVELQAAMGVVQLKRFPQMAQKRRQNAKAFSEFFKQFEKYFILPRSLPKADPCWFSFPLTIKKEAPFTRLDITKYLEEKLIETRTVFAGNITRQPAMRRVNYRVVGPLDNSDTILKDTFFIGLGPHIGTAELTYMEEIFTDYLNQWSKKRIKRTH